MHEVEKLLFWRLIQQIMSITNTRFKYPVASSLLNGVTDTLWLDTPGRSQYGARHGICKLCTQSKCYLQCIAKWDWNYWFQCGSISSNYANLSYFLQALSCGAHQLYHGSGFIRKRIEL